MATINAATSEKVISLKQFLGINENPDGDNKLKVGEATICRNFKVTNSGNLMKRYGTTLKWTLGIDKPIMGMWHGYCSHHEITLAACDGHLFMLQDDEIKEYPIDLGSFNTTNDAFMFGFDEQVFILNGSQYGHVWHELTPVPASASASYTPDSQDPGSVTNLSVDVDLYSAAVGESGTYDYYYTADGWATGLSEYVDFDELGITYDGTANIGDKIVVVYSESSSGAWYYENLADGSKGYRPLVAIAIPPNGGGELLEQVNKLNGMRRVTISPDGVADTFTMPEKDLESIDYVIKTDDPDNPLVPGTDYDFDLEDGTVTFDTVPALGVQSYEIGYSVSTHFAGTIGAMRYAEMYAGTQDTRLFIYGNGTNRTFYSGIDYNGHARGDYFPDPNEVTVGDTNTPITGLIRHYSKMLAFKPNATYSIDYGVVTMADGLLTPAFYTTPVNRVIGNEALGQVQLVLNAPLSLCEGNLYEWRNGSSYSANVSVDERQAKRISDRIYSTLRKMDFSKVHCFDDNLNTEYYIIGDDGNCLVLNYSVDAWYYYTDLNARTAMAIDGKMYFGTYDGKIILLDETKMADMGKPIKCLWESGSMDFGAAYMRKYSALMWIGVKAEEHSAVTVTVKTDRSEENTEVDVEPEYEFDMPKITRTKVKVKKFVYYKLCFKTESANTKVTVVDTEIKVRYTAQAK